MTTGFDKFTEFSIFENRLAQKLREIESLQAKIRKVGGVLLKDLRKSHGLTLREAATRLGMRPDYLNHLESGRRTVTTALYRRAAKLYCEAAP